MTETLVRAPHTPALVWGSPLRIAVADYGSRLASWAQWQPVSVAAQGAPVDL